MPYIIKVALDIEVRFESLAPMTSPLGAYCAIGAIAGVMKPGLPERKDALFEMRDQLDADMENSGPEDSRIAKIHVIPKGFIWNEDTTDQMTEYVTYGYESERWYEREVKQ